MEWLELLIEINIDFFYLNVYSEGNLSKQQVAYISHTSENKKNIKWTQVNIIDHSVSVGSKVR